MNKFLILDGNSVLHRAYYAMPEWRNRSGEATSGVYGFLSMWLKVTEEIKPTHLIIVFDTPEPTFRHLMYVGYQINREKDRQISEDIWGQVEKLRIVFEKMKVPVYSIAGFEADDVVGTLCAYLTPTPLLSLGEGNQRGEVNEVTVVTGDKDYMQLVTENVHLYMPQKGLSDGIVIDRDKVKEKLGVWPEQVIDYKALAGDSSDNYPGVTGIGPKTAVSLLEAFGSFEEIYKQITNTKSQVPNKFQISKSQIEKLINGYEGGELSKRLATIKTDVPLSLEIDGCKVPNLEEITKIFKELGYGSLIKRVSGEDVKIDDTQSRLFDL